MTVTVKTEIDFAPWATPNFARTETPDGDADKALAFPVEEIGIEVIDALASRWLDNLYARLNKPSPWRMTGERASR